MGIIRGGDAQYNDGGPSFEEKSAQLAKKVGEALQKDSTVLNLKGQYFSTDEVKILSVMEEVKTVRSLDLSDNQIGNPAINILFQSPVLEGLEELNLGINYITDDGILQICSVSSIGLKSLKVLSLSENSISDESGTELVRSAHFDNLERLDLGWNEIGNETAKALGETHALPKLKSLVLERGYIDDEGLKVFTEGGLIGHLDELNLSANKLTDQGAKILSAAPSLSSLRVLHLSQNLIADIGAQALGESTILSGLAHLYIGRNHFSPEGAKHLIESKTLTNLKSLILQEGVETTPGLVNYSRPELLRPEDP